MSTRTPRRAAVKRTPYKTRAQKQTPEEETRPELSKVADLIRHYREKDKIREEYVKAIKEENAHLRSVGGLSSVNYEDFIGLSITKSGDTVNCTQKIEKENRTSYISFSLIYLEEKNVYNYIFNGTNIEDLPEFLKDEIHFEADQIKLFFFNVYECVAKRE